MDPDHRGCAAAALALLECAVAAAAPAGNETHDPVGDLVRCDPGVGCVNAGPQVGALDVRSVTAVIGDAGTVDPRDDVLVVTTRMVPGSGVALDDPANHVQWTISFGARGRGAYARFPAKAFYSLSAASDGGVEGSVTRAPNTPGQTVHIAGGSVRRDADRVVLRLPLKALGVLPAQRFLFLGSGLKPLAQMLMVIGVSTTRDPGGEAFIDHFSDPCPSEPGPTSSCPGSRSNAPVSRAVAARSKC